MRMKSSSVFFHFFFGLVLASFSFHALASAENQPVGRSSFSLGINAAAVYGSTDRYDAYFDIPTNNIKNGLYGGSFEIAGVSQNHMGFTLRGGYKRLFYTSIGLAQSAKNYYTSDILFSYSFPKTVTRWDPYFIVGPGLIYSRSGVQAFAKTGLGARYFFNRHLSINLSPLIVTDFTGVRGEGLIGLNLHFYPRLIE